MSTKITAFKDVHPSDDGHNIEMLLTGLSSLHLTMSSDLADLLVSNLIRSLAAARANRAMPPANVKPDRKVILTDGFSINLYSDHSMDLIIESDEQEHFQVSLTNTQGASLRDVLLQGDGKRPPLQIPDLPIH